MRSPWQVLKSFASRTKPDDVQKRPDDVQALIEPDDEATSAEPPAELTAPDTQIADVPVYAPEEQPSAANADPVRTTPTPVGSSPLSTEPTDPVAAVESVMVASATNNAKAKTQLERQLKTRRPKSQSTAVPEKQSAATAQLDAPRASLSDRDHAEILDAEINDLRSRLAQKLVEQNRQLRNMLDRYDD